MSEISLNKPQIDYFTITSYCDNWYIVADKMCVMVNGDYEQRHRMQYSGKLRRTENGTIFLGTAEINGRTHHLLQVDGELAYDLRFYILDFYPSYIVKCTRVDFQVTIREPRNWKQWDLLIRFKKKYGEQMVSYPKPSTMDGKILQTVYLGNRTGADRFLRVYVKLSKDSDKLLRLETELKRNRSHAVYVHMCNNRWDEDVYEMMVSELKYQSMKDVLLHQIFSSCLEGYSNVIKVQTKESNTARWITDVCIPAIDSHLHSHSADDKIVIENQILKLAEYIVWRQHE